MELNDLEKIDARGMFKTYDRWPEIASEAFEKKFEKIQYDNIDHIVFAGMGGSGSIGDTIAAILSKENIHISNVKGFSLPKTVDSKTLVVVTSVSGITKESLEILQNAKKTSAKIASFSSGGSVESFCHDNDIFFQKISMAHSPRASYSSFLFSILNILEPILPISERDVHEALISLAKTREEISSHNLNKQNRALQLAEFTKQIACIIYPHGLQAAATRYKNSLQENTKMHAMTENVIETCHNGIVAWEKKSNVSPVLLRGKDDHISTIERWNILEGFFKSNNTEFHVVNSVSGSILSKITNLVYLLDYASIYASILQKIDPSPVNSIDFIKSKLRE